MTDGLMVPSPELPRPAYREKGSENDAVLVLSDFIDDVLF